MLRFIAYFLKKKLRERTHILTLRNLMRKEDFGSVGSRLPKVFGGKYSRQYRSWILERLQYREEIKSRVVIP